MIGLSALILIGLLIYVGIILFKICREDESFRDGLKKGLIGGGILVASGLFLQGLGYVIGYAIEGEYGARLGSDIGGIIFCSAILIFIIVYNIYLHFFWQP